MPATTAAADKKPGDIENIEEGDKGESSTFLPLISISCTFEHCAPMRRELKLRASCAELAHCKRHCLVELLAALGN